MKVQISHQSGKKYPHDLSHDINTTSSFGFCQPILSRQLNAQDTVSLRFGQICRLNPLAKPTFGQMKLKTYTSFVKAEDIWHAYGSFLSGQTYGGAVNSYIPTYLPSISCRVLMGLCVMFGDFDVFNFDSKEADYRGGYSYYGLERVSAGDETPYKDLLMTTFFGNGVSVTELQLIQTLVNTHFGTQDTWFPLYHRVTYDVTPGSDQISNLDWYFESSLNGVPLLFCGRYNNIGRNLRKVFIGNGYQLNFDTTRVDVLPLFANYKAYFDIFVPQRNITWKDTPAFKIMEFCEQSGLNDFRDFGNLFDDGHFYDFFNFILDLSTMYYTIPGDYASAHILGLGTDVVPTSFFNYLSNEGVSNQVVQPAANGVIGGTGIYDTVSYQSDITRSALRILNEMQKLSNLHSAVGGNIREYLRAVYNSDYNDDVDSAFIGSQILDISPEPVFNTAETTEAALGEFGGQALGSTSGKNLKFTAKSPGYLISFFCVVPEARMSQGVDPILYHQVKEDIFNPKYDALTLLPTRKTAIYGTEEVSFGSTSLSGGFGNIPNFSEYKIKHNILNGDMSLPSTRSSYLPFTLDKLLPYRFAKVQSDGRFTLSPGVSSSVLTAGTFWRYIGMNRYFGNFDRIFVYDEFVDSEQDSKLDPFMSFDDNFIIQMYADFNVTGYELPLTRSFDTGEMDGDVMTVEKS